MAPPSPPEIFVYIVVQDKFHTDVKTHALAVFDAHDGQLTNRVQVCALMFRTEVKLFCWPGRLSGKNKLVQQLTRKCSASQRPERPDLHPAAAAGAPERGRVRRERPDGRLRPRGGLLGGAALLPVHVEAVQGGGGGHSVPLRHFVLSQSHMTSS